MTRVVVKPDLLRTFRGLWRSMTPDQWDRAAHSLHKRPVIGCSYCPQPAREGKP